MDIQQQLVYLTREEVKDIISPKLRGVSAFWKGHTAHISFFFDGEITDFDRDAASDVCTYIISHFSDGLLEENYIRLDYPNPLPKQFLVYSRD
jgi:hypothetical protein